MTGFQKRVVEEAKELKVKLDALSEFIKGNFFAEVLDEDNKELLITQRRHMKNYLFVLEERIELF